MHEGWVAHPQQGGPYAGSNSQAYRSSLSLSPPASSPSSVQRTSPMTWTTSTIPPLASGMVGPGSFEPQTPPPSVGLTGVIDPYLPSAWGVPNAEYDPSCEFTPVDDQLLVKASHNAPARPLHTYMAPLSLNSQPIKPPSPPPSKRIDMRLAQPGSEESKPGYMTPLASYTATTFWYFWHADMFAPMPTRSPQRRMSEDLHSSTSRPFDSEGRPRHPITSGLHANLPFCQFVFSVLHSTQVSFSVTILALMYTYKYKKIMALGRRPPYHSEVSEAQAFVTGLMLANKYLDDNTYTNTTWAQFLGLPVKDVNDYELEWLDALEFNLCVKYDEFEKWRTMLDAHIQSRERSRDRAVDATSLSNGTIMSPVANGGRARSASPPIGYYSQTSPPDHLMRKRTAGDAFAADVLHNTGMYEAARLGPRKASFVGQPNQLPTPAPSAVSPTAAAGPGLGRSSSLNRQIARLPNGRRDSFSLETGAPTEVDLRHAAAANTAAQQQWVYQEPIQFNKDERWRVPVQPRLYFLQAAATPQCPNAGPRFHKAIPHYFDAGYGSAFEAGQYAVQQQQQQPNLGHVDLASPTDPTFGGMVNGQIMPGFAQHIALAQQPQPGSHFVDPQPAQFANAGPPGYAYGAPGWSQPAPPPHQHQHQHQTWQRQWKPGHATRWSTSSDEATMYHLRPAPLCGAVSEWSTPLQPLQPIQPLQLQPFPAFNQPLQSY